MAKLITPEIFQKNTAEDYLKAAIDTAEWIDTLAIKTEYGSAGRTGWIPGGCSIIYAGEYV